MIKLSKRFILTWCALCITGLALCAQMYLKQAEEEYKTKEYVNSKIDEMKHDSYLLDRIESFKKQ